MSLLNAFFLIHSETMPSSRIRVLDLIPELAKHGVTAQAEAIPKSFFQRRKLYKEAGKSSVVVLQKRLLPWLDFRQLRAAASTLVYDFDDAIYFRAASPSSNPKDYESSTRRERFGRTARGVDFIIAANRILAEGARAHAPNTPTAILPSPIITDGIMPKADYTVQSEPVLGWVGTSATLRYLELVYDALVELQQRHGAVLHVVADQQYAPEGLKTRFTPWNLDEQYDIIRSFDIGLMPLSADPFSEGKASFKMLQYMACGVPSVCSPVGMNVEVAAHGKNSLVAGDSAQFVAQIERLFADEELRMRLGKNGRQTILSTYSVDVVGKKLAEILKNVAAMPC